jgi:hypothetical protein
VSGCVLLAANTILLLLLTSILFLVNMKAHISWANCHHGVARPQVVEGGNSHQTRKVDANMWDKQSRISDKVRRSVLGLGWG